MRNPGRAVDDSAATLRRVERDLHDGAQARLVALAMGLGMAREKLGEGASEADMAPKVRTCWSTYGAPGRERAIVELLRDLARGIHPPALDNGLAGRLVDARGALARPRHADCRHPHGGPRRPSRPSPTSAPPNCSPECRKHSAAGEVTIDARERGGVLQLRVLDDGIGGADLGRGSGLK